MDGTKPQIIMGIDPGTYILGYGVIRVGKRHPEYVDMGVLDMRKIPEHFEKIAYIFREVSRLIGMYSPDVLSIESPFYGKNPQVTLKLGRAQGAAITAALRRGIPVYEYAPRKAKLAITGIGAASKEQVSTMIQKILGVSIENKFLDATDALALAMCHFYRMTDPLADMHTSSGWETFIRNNPDRIK